MARVVQMVKIRQGDAVMASTLESLGLDRLSIEDRLALADEIWESVARETQANPLTESQRSELERRLADSDLRPDQTTDWSDILRDALARSQR
jgi:putative addiction module component (TIGR02574 family)